VSTHNLPVAFFVTVIFAAAARIQTALIDRSFSAWEKPDGSDG
jgi:hypothetical protein